jgi:hypothetical protein
MKYAVEMATDQFRYSKVVRRGYTCRHTDTDTHKKHTDSQVIS